MNNVQQPKANVVKIVDSYTKKPQVLINGMLLKAVQAYQIDRQIGDMAVVTVSFECELVRSEYEDD